MKKKDQNTSEPPTSPRKKKKERETSPEPDVTEKIKKKKKKKKPKLSEDQEIQENTRVSLRKLSLFLWKQKKQK